MKTLFRISFLMAVLCLAVPVYADGDMTTGNKNCTTNCGLAGGTIQIPPTPNDEDQTGTSFEDFCSWIYEQIAEII